MKMKEKQCPMKNKKPAPRPLYILLSPNLMKQDIYVDIELCNICLMRKYKKEKRTIYHPFRRHSATE